MRFRLCSLLKYLGGRGKLRFLRTEMFFQSIPVLRSAYFPKKLFSFFSKTLDLQVRFALPTMPHRNIFSRHSGVMVGLFSEKALQLFSSKRSASRFASLSLRWAGEASLPPAPLSPAPEKRERTGRRKAHSTGWEEKPRAPPKAALCGRAADAGTAKPGARFACAGFARAGWEAPRGSGGAAAPPVCPAAGAAGQTDLR